VKPINILKNNWEINPDDYMTKENGSFILKKDGTPRKKAGRPVGSKGTLNQKIKNIKKKERKIKQLIKQVEIDSLNIPPSKRTSSTIPFGYKLNIETKELEPIEKELQVLKEVEETILDGNFSLREGADYLFEKTNRYLSAPGLRKIMENKYGKHCCSKKEKGWLYIVECQSIPGWVKFGRSIDPEKRLQQYNQVTPLRDYSLVDVCRCSNLKKGEKIILSIASFFAESERGEWKKLNRKLAINILKVYNNKYETKQRKQKKI
tara:strand:- start:11 stop:799 length:789 start_codon:yes stop_codon:yes gene_type:complete